MRNRYPLTKKGTQLGAIIGLIAAVGFWGLFYFMLKIGPKNENQDPITCVEGGLGTWAGFILLGLGVGLFHDCRKMRRRQPQAALELEERRIQIVPVAPVPENETKEERELAVFRMFGIFAKPINKNEQPELASSPHFKKGEIRALRSYFDKQREDKDESSLFAKFHGEILDYMWDPVSMTFPIEGGQVKTFHYHRPEILNCKFEVQVLDPATREWQGTGEFLLRCPFTRNEFPEKKLKTNKQMIKDMRSHLPAAKKYYASLPKEESNPSPPILSV